MIHWAVMSNGVAVSTNLPVETYCRTWAHWTPAVLGALEARTRDYPVQERVEILQMIREAREYQGRAD